MNKILSVVIPLYNKKQTVCRAVSSVLNQTYRDFELIIVDDGSVDGSIDIVKSNFDDCRIRYISQDNLGVSSARNNGVKNSVGEWVFFLDADDIWLPSYLAEMYGVIERNPDANMVGCASFGAYIYSSLVHTDRMIDKFYNKESRVNFFENMDIMSHIGATGIKKDSFWAVGGFDLKISNNEDILLMAKLALGNNYFYLGKMLHVYMLDVPGQVTKNPAKKTIHMKDVLFVMNTIYEYSLQYDNDYVKSALQFRFHDYILRFLKTKDYYMIKY